MTRWSAVSDSGRIRRGTNCLAVPDRLHGRLVDAEDGDFRRIDDRREVGAADAAEAGNGEAGAGHVGRLELAVTRLLGQIAGFLRQFEDRLLVDVLDHRDDQTIRRVGRKADVEILLQHQIVAVERGIEFREFLQALDASLDQESEHGQLGAATLLVFLVEQHAEGFEVGDVGIFVIGHRRDHHPVARQVLAGNLLDARQRLDLDLAELGEIDLRPGQQIEHAAADHAAGRRGDRAGNRRRSSRP